MGRPRLAIPEGERFGRLVVLEEAAPARSSASRWVCRCDCGITKPIIANKLRRGETHSCGACSKVVHGHARHPLYPTWRAMRSRCQDPRNKEWANYGGRGISVCDRWAEIKNFLSDMGPKPTPDHSLDRIDNDGNYEPSNCRWATAKEQRANRRDS